MIKVEKNQMKYIEALFQGMALSRKIMSLIEKS